jgi:hypothetical protein
MTSRASNQPEHGPEHEREQAVEAALGRLGLDAKAAVLSGADMWSLPAFPEIGLGRLVMSDGPAGVRGEQRTAEDPSLALPSPSNDGLLPFAAPDGSGIPASIAVIGAAAKELRIGGYTLKAAHSSGDVRVVTRLEVPLRQGC